MALDQELFTAVQEHKFSDGVCFLCGATLTSANRTVEHVIPQWVQDRFQLWNQTVSLLNRTTIPYRQLTVPCCKPCNGDHLQPIEFAISNAVAQGPDAVRELGEHTIFIWLGKIFYGLLYRELFLALDRSDLSSEAITTPELLQQFQMHHYLLQSCRVPMLFDNFFPATIVVYETKLTPDPRHRWYFRDCLDTLFISCQMGRVGIIATLQDGGAQHQFRAVHERYQQRALHPAQFVELSAQACYLSRLFNRTPKYIIGEQDPIWVTQMPLAGLSGSPIFDEWSQGDYAHILSEFTGCSLELIHQPPDIVMTWLRQPNDEFKDIDFDQFPWPPSTQGPD